MKSKHSAVWASVALWLGLTGHLACLNAQPASDSMELALRELRSGNAAKAQQLLEQLTNDNPRLFQAWYLLGFVRQTQRDYQGAVVAYAKLLRTWTCREPDDTFGFDAMGLGDIDHDGAVDFLLISAWSSVRHARAGRGFVLSSKADQAPRRSDN